MDSVDQRSSARSVQSDLDQHFPQKLVSSTVRKELNYLVQPIRKCVTLEFGKFWRICDYDRL